MKFWIAKDEKGILRPTIFVCPVEGPFGKASKEEWDEKISKKKTMGGIILVMCEIIEVL